MPNKHKRHAPSSHLSLTDRVGYAAWGAAFGAAIGFVLFWLLGVYSNILGPTGFVTEPTKLVALIAAAFAAIGFIFGSSVGAAVGNTISAILEFERASFLGSPTWLLVLLLTAVALAVWYWLR